MQTPTERSVGEMYRMYAPAVDAMLGSLVRAANAMPLLGKNNFETVRNVALREGYMRALEEIRQHFMKHA